jgi:hypothetical protein
MTRLTHSKTKWKCWPIAVLLVVCVVDARGTGGSLLLPRLSPGQSMRYRVTARFERKTKTDSRVASMLQTPDLYRDLSGEIGLLVKQVLVERERPVVSATTRWIEPDPSPLPDASKRVVEFAIGANGNLTQMRGLDDLDAEQRVAWQFWVGRFALGWTLPLEGMKPGEKSKSREDEKTDSPIAGMYWEKETTYVHDDKCPIVTDETCAVFLTEAVLKQTSSNKDSTPDDYKARALKTMGKVKGKNQTITYISQKSGLLVRATEDAEQEMDVIIVKTDGSNGVHYKVNATSHQEALLEMAEDGKK